MISRNNLRCRGIGPATMEGKNSAEDRYAKQVVGGPSFTAKYVDRVAKRLEHVEGKAQTQQPIKAVAAENRKNFQARQCS